MLIFGLGYSAGAIAARLRARGWEIEATGAHGNLAFDDEAAIRATLSRASHILSSVPPQGDLDPVLARYETTLAEAARGGAWLGYLSSTGVYGDAGGAWVDESAPVGPAAHRIRRMARAEADLRWLGLGARVFRLPGIYGPGRSAFERIAEGRARRIDLAGQVFSRIHVEDIASGVIAAIDIAAISGGNAAPPGAYNLADDEPCHPNLVIEEACRLIGAPPPLLLRLDDPALPAEARAFYEENRRIANGKARRLLGWRPLYPNWREGLAAILRAREGDQHAAQHQD